MAVGRADSTLRAVEVVQPCRIRLQRKLRLPKLIASQRTYYAVRVVLVARLIAAELVGRKDGRLQKNKPDCGGNKLVV